MMKGKLKRTADEEKNGDEEEKRDKEGDFSIEFTYLYIYSMCI